MATRAVHSPSPRSTRRRCPSWPPAGGRPALANDLGDAPLLSERLRYAPLWVPRESSPSLSATGASGLQLHHRPGRRRETAAWAQSCRVVGAWRARAANVGCSEPWRIGSTACSFLQQKPACADTVVLPRGHDGKKITPWLVWLNGLSVGLRSKGSLVRFPVRAHAWGAGQVPSRGRARSNHTLMFLSLPSPISKNK